MGCVGEVQWRDWLANSIIGVVKLGSREWPPHSIGGVAVMGITTRLRSWRRSRERSLWPLRFKHRCLVVRCQRMVSMDCIQHHPSLAHCTLAMVLLHICTPTPHRPLFIRRLVPG